MTGRFEQELIAAAETYGAGGDPRAALDGMYLAVAAALHHAQDIGLTERAKPLLALMGALADLREGRDCPALAPAPESKPHNRPMKPAGVEYRRATAAVAVTLLHAEGVPLKDACQRTAQVCARLGLIAPGQPGWQQVRDWRRKIRLGLSDPSAARDGLEEMYFTVLAGARAQQASGATLLQALAEV